MRISDWSSDVCSSDLCLSVRDDRRGRLIAAQRIAPIDVPGRSIATHQIFIGLADSDGATYISGAVPDELSIMTHIAPSARYDTFWHGHAPKISVVNRYFLQSSVTNISFPLFHAYHHFPIPVLY